MSSGQSRTMRTFELKWSSSLGLRSFMLQFCQQPAQVWLSGVENIFIGKTVRWYCGNVVCSYHPMDRSHNSNCCGRILVASAVILLGSIPFLLLISTFLFAYTQAHNGVCPLIQAYSQNQNIQQYANANFEFFDPYNLLDFLNDLAVERVEINQFNCEVFSRPLQATLF